MITRRKEEACPSTKRRGPTVDVTTEDSPLMEVDQWAELYVAKLFELEGIVARPPAESVG